jgi:hypothetical protein
MARTKRATSCRRWGGMRLRCGVCWRQLRVGWRRGRVSINDPFWYLVEIEPLSHG